MGPASISSWVSTIRRFAGWISLTASGSLFIVIMVMFWKYPYAYYVPSPPAAPRWMLSWRNYSLLVGFISSLIALPKWQSLVALPAVILLFIFSVITSD